MDVSRIYIGALCGREEAMDAGVATYCVELEASGARQRLCGPALRRVMEEMAFADGEMICIARLAMPGGRVIWDGCRLSEVTETYRGRLMAMSAAPAGEQGRRQ